MGVAIMIANQIAETHGQLSDLHIPKVGQVVDIRNRTYLVETTLSSLGSFSSGKSR
jgi:hypothetical protein